MFSWKSRTNLKELHHSEKQTGILVVFFNKTDGKNGGCQAKKWRLPRQGRQEAGSGRLLEQGRLSGRIWYL